MTRLLLALATDGGRVLAEEGGRVLAADGGRAAGRVLDLGRLLVFFALDEPDVAVDEDEDEAVEAAVDVEGTPRPRFPSKDGRPRIDGLRRRVGLACTCPGFGVVSKSSLLFSSLPLALPPLPPDTLNNTLDVRRSSTPPPLLFARIVDANDGRVSVS